MGKRRGVSLIVDENFFKTFEKERQAEQAKLRQEFGGMFNLGQRKFTAILDAKKFRFTFPRGSPINLGRKRKLR